MWALGRRKVEGAAVGWANWLSGPETKRKEGD
jgi:hypothetical protein